MRANLFNYCLAGLGLALVSGTLAGCGDNDDLICAPGTFKDGANCSAFDPKDKTAPVTTATPDGARKRTRVSTVQLVSDEPATIHFTTDGSDPDPAGEGEPSPVVIPLSADATTIKFFAVDAAGNVEATQSQTYEYDVTAPAPVTNLAVSGTGTVTWTNPTDADYAGTLVARVDDIVDFAPKPGTVYASTDTLTTSVHLLSTAATTQVADPGRPVGPVRYVAWTFDSLGNYSAARTVEGVIGTLNTVATFTFDTSTNTLTQTVMPTSLDFTGTTADRTGNTVTLHLSVKNQTSYFFQNPKILVTAVTNATFNNSDGTADGSPFAGLGFQFLGPAATRTKDLTFSGAVANSVVQIDLNLGSHASLVSGGPPRRRGGDHSRRFVDLGSGLANNAIGQDTPGPRGNSNSFSHRPMLTGHRFLDIPTSHGLDRWDMTTLTRAGGAFSGEHVLSLLGDGIYKYAIITSRRRGGAIRVAQIDDSFQPIATLDLLPRSGQGFGSATISSDGSTIAFPGTPTVQLVDTRTMTVKDADPSTPTVDSYDTGLTRVRAVEFFGNSAGLVAMDRDGRVAVIKFGGANGYSVTQYSSNGRGDALARSADGRVWITGSGGLRIYDPTTDTITASAYNGGGVIGITIVDGQMWVLRDNRVQVDQIDSTGAIQATKSITASGYGHWLGTTK